jgi:hypothetical protein
MAKKLLNLRLDEEMKEAWEAAAAEQGVAVSEYVREAVETKRTGRAPQPQALTGVVEPLASKKTYKPDPK